LPMNEGQTNGMHSGWFAVTLLNKSRPSISHLASETNFYFHSDPLSVSAYFPSISLDLKFKPLALTIEDPMPV
jgi:hypothetical protein